MLKFPKRELGLIFATYRKNVQWAVDFDYIENLRRRAKFTNPVLAKEAQDALQFLNQFSEEYYEDRLNKYGDKALHNTPELKQSTSRNKNARNRDLYAIKDCSGLISSTEEEANNHEG